MHFFFQAQDVSNWWTGIAEGIGDETNSLVGINNNILIVDNVWDTYDSNTGELGKWGKYGLLNHEAAHLLGLRHTFLQDNGIPNDPNEPCPDTAQNYRCDCLRFNIPRCDEIKELDNNVMNYNNDKTAWTPCQLCIIHDYFSNRTPTYIIQDYCTNHQPPVYVPEEAPTTTGEIITWNSTRNMQGDIIVRSGNTLIISCTVRMPDNARIIVERGAKLILGGGNITNACEPDPVNGITGMWGGIEVWGNAANPHWNGNGQFISPAELIGTNANSYPQDVDDHGVVVLINDAILENAFTAITTRNTTVSNGEGFYGGIIYAEDSQFLNNGRAVEFMRFGPNLFPFNASHFEDCTFLVDNEYHGTGNYRFVTMWDVQWEAPDLNAANPVFTFENCTFESEFNPIEVVYGLASTSHRALYALHAIDAQFYVNSSRFVHMEVGIDLWSKPNLFRELWVIGTNDLVNYDFHENLLGINTNSLAYTDINHNSFLGLTNPTNNHLVSSGVYCLGNDFYDVYDNIFHELHGGIFAARTGTLPSDIWGNVIRDGNFAIGALGSNNGLLITCNDMDRMNFDIGVFNDGQAGTVNPVQGGAPDPDGQADPTIAGNLFSDFTTCPYTDTHITNGNNNANAPFRYIFSTDNLRWVPRCIVDQTIDQQSNVILQENDTYEACGANGGGNPQGGLPSGFYNPCMDQPCLDDMAAYIQVEEQPLIDGDAQILKDAINNAPTSTATKTALLNESPYLSDAVLTLVVNQTAMNETDAKDVLAANPPLSEAVWETINNRQPAFGSATIAAIQQAANGRTLSDRDALRNWITTVARKRSSALYRLVLAEIRANDWAGALSFLQGENSDDAQQLSVRLHLTNGDISSATSLLTAMHSNTLDNVYFKDIENLYISLVQNGETYFDINTTEEDMLRVIANSNTKAAAKARSILTLVTGETFSLFIPSLPNSSSKHFNRMKLADSQLFQLRPNPSRNATWLYLEEGVLGEQLEVVIYDLQGSQQGFYQLEAHQQKLWMPTDHLSEGVYICVLKVNGVHTEQLKMVVLK